MRLKSRGATTLEPTKSVMAWNARVQLMAWGVMYIFFVYIDIIYIIYCIYILDINLSHPVLKTLHFFTKPTPAIWVLHFWLVESQPRVRQRPRPIFQPCRTWNWDSHPTCTWHSDPKNDGFSMLLLYQTNFLHQMNPKSWLQKSLSWYVHHRWKQVETSAHSDTKYSGRMGECTKHWMAAFM